MKKKKRSYWTKDRCQKKALKYKHRSDFKRRDYKAYQAACSNGLMDEICGHMVRKFAFSASKEKCIKIHSKCKTNCEFKFRHAAAYNLCVRNGWLGELPEKDLTKVICWTKEILTAEALKYKFRTEFSNKKQGAYRVARENGWLNEVCSHMPRRRPKSNRIKPKYVHRVIMPDGIFVVYKISNYTRQPVTPYSC